MLFASTLTLSIIKAYVYYGRNLFHLTKLCPLEHWDRLPIRLRQNLLNKLIKVGSRSLEN